MCQRCVFLTSLKFTFKWKSEYGEHIMHVESFKVRLHSQRSPAVLFLNVRLTAGVVQVHCCVQPGSVGV